MTQGTRKFREFEMPPPGKGLTTVTTSGPVVATALAGISAVTSVLLTSVVVATALPFHRTVDAGTKFVPTTLRVKPGPPRVLLFGDRAAMVGAGLVADGGGEVLVPPQAPIRRKLQARTRNNGGFPTRFPNERFWFRQSCTSRARGTGRIAG